MNAEAQHRPNEPTEADLRRALCGLTQSTLDIATKLMGALEAGRGHFPVQAVPILDALSRDFHQAKSTTEAMLAKVAA